MRCRSDGPLVGSCEMVLAAVVAHGDWITPSEVAAALGLSPRTAGVVMWFLRKRGLLEWQVRKQTTGTRNVPDGSMRSVRYYRALKEVVDDKS